MQKYTLTILLFLPLFGMAQSDISGDSTGSNNTGISEVGLDFLKAGSYNTAICGHVKGWFRLLVTPSDSLNKYQKLYKRDQDSLKKYAKKAGWNVHYFKLCEKRKEQIHHWSEQIYLMDRQKRGSKS